MREYIPFSTMEQLLLTAISLPGSNIKPIAAATGIQANTLYKCPPIICLRKKADRLLLYFMEQEPQRLEMADTTKEDIPAVFYKQYPAYVAKQMNVGELARMCGLSRPTVYKYLKLII